MCAAVAVALRRGEYLFRAILIPFLILSLAALGLNILVGYCGQISLGTGAFMAVGAYAAYNPGAHRRHAADRHPCCWAACSPPSAGAVRHPACASGACTSPWPRWPRSSSRLGLPAHQVVHQRLVLGLGQRPGPEVLGWKIETPVQKYLFCLGFLVRLRADDQEPGAQPIGREWMAIRDMDVAAAVIGIRPVYAKLTAFAVSSFIVGVAGALWGFVHLGSWEPAAFNIDRSFQLLFMVIIGGLGSIMGSFFGAAFIVVLPIVLDTSCRTGSASRSTGPPHLTFMIFGALIVFFLIVEPTARAPVVHRQGEAAPVALPALTARSPEPTHRRVPFPPTGGSARKP